MWSNPLQYVVMTRELRGENNNTYVRVDKKLNSELWNVKLPWIKIVNSELRNWFLYREFKNTMVLEFFVF